MLQLPVIAQDMGREFMLPADDLPRRQCSLKTAVNRDEARGHLAYVPVAHTSCGDVGNLAAFSSAAVAVYPCFSVDGKPDRKRWTCARMTRGRSAGISMR